MNILIQCQASCGLEEIERNIVMAPDASEPGGGCPLAVVGGGHSVLKHLNELREWDGEIWAINQTARYLSDQGIKCWFYSVDPSPELKDFVHGDAVLADHCHPSTFAAVKGELRKIKSPNYGPTSAYSAGYSGLRLGYTSVTWFGCESSYGEETHVYRNEPVKGLVRVQVGDESFLTKLELVVQAEKIAELVRLNPFFKEKSGGLTGAMVKTPDWEVTHAPREMIERISNDQGISMERMAV